MDRRIFACLLLSIFLISTMVLAQEEVLVEEAVYQYGEHKPKTASQYTQEVGEFYTSLQGRMEEGKDAAFKTLLENKHIHLKEALALKYEKQIDVLKSILATHTELTDAQKDYQIKFLEKQQQEVSAFFDKIYAEKTAFFSQLPKGSDNSAEINAYFEKEIAETERFFQERKATSEEIIRRIRLRSGK